MYILGVYAFLKMNNKTFQVKQKFYFYFGIFTKKINTKF